MSILKLAMIGLFASACAIVSSPSVAAQEHGAEPERKVPLVDRAADVVALLRGERDPQIVFAPAFLSAVPAEQLAAIPTQLQAQFGDVVGLLEVTASNENSGRIVIEYEKAFVAGPISIEAAAPYRITGLLLNDITEKNDSIARLTEDFAALPGKAGFMVARLGAGGIDPLYAHNRDTRFAVGSAFKLYVLAELSEQVRNGERNWNDVVTVDRRSFESGVIYTLPDNAPVTLQTLATLMISISDNTATDVLIRTLGRDRIGARMIAAGHSAPETTSPFMTTVEAIGLKAGNTSDIRERFLAAPENEQADILDAAADRLTSESVDLSIFAANVPQHIDTIEWFLTPADAVRLVNYLHRQNDPTTLAIMAVNAGIIDATAADWDYVGFKGGSEPGVMNMTLLAKAGDGTAYAVTGSWNDTEKDIDQAKFAMIMDRLVKLIAQ